MQGQSEASPITMRAFPSNEGYFKYGEWLLLWVELENPGPDMQASVEVRVPGSSGSVVYSAPVDLPTNSRKRVLVYVLPNNFSRELVVQLHSQTQLLAQESVPVNPQLNNTYLVGLLAAERGALSLVNGAAIPSDRPRQLFLVDVPQAEFPAKFEVLRSLDTLVINDIDTSLFDADQKRAIELWVRQGGNLVLGGGSGAQKTLAGLPLSLVPFTFEALEELQELTALVGFSAHSATGEEQTPPVEEPIRVPGPFLAAVGEPVDSRILSQQGSVPLVFEKKVGNGTVTFAALDLSSSPFDAWAGTVHFWENLLSPGAAFPDWIPPDVSNRQQMAGQMPYTLTNLPMLDLPSIRLLAFWLVLYILIIGPLNYFILRKKQRLHLAWITIPAITLVFSIGAFGLGYALHGTDVFVNKISVVELVPDGQSQVTSYIGVFSPAQRAYELGVSGDGLISAMSPFYNPWDSAVPAGSPSGRELRLVQGDPGLVQGVSIEQWSMHSFMVEGMQADIGNVGTSLRFQDQALTGTLRNNSGQMIREAVIFINKSVYRIGDLAAGQEVQVDFPVVDQASLDFGPSLSYIMFQDQLNQPNGSGTSARDAEVKRQIVEAMFERTPAYQLSSAKTGRSGAGVRSTPIFLGWIEEAPPLVTVRDTEPGNQTTAVVLLPLNFDLPGGAVIIPAGWIPGQLVQNPIDGGTCGEPGTASVYLNRGSATFSFTLPGTLRTVEPERLRLSLWSDAGGTIGSPEIAVYDWLSQSWTTLSGIHIGVNLVPQAEQFISANAEIRVRLSPADTGQGCYFLAMGLEGSAP